MDNAIIPEITIYHYLKYFLKLLKDSVDFSSTESIIEEIFFGVEPIGNYDPIKESRRIFSKVDSLYLNMGFNINPAELPAIHIILPDENLEWEGIGWSAELEENEDGTSTERKEVSFNTAYNLIILDKNADAVVYIYHILKYLFLSFNVNLELDGFQTLKISGRDLIQQSGLIPVDIYSRNLTLSFKYKREFLGLKNLVKIGHFVKVREKQIDMKGIAKDLNVSKVLDTVL